MDGVSEKISKPIAEINGAPRLVEFDREKLSEIAHSEKWAALRPNCPSVDSLLPSELSSGDLEKIIHAVAQPEFVNLLGRPANRSRLSTTTAAHEIDIEDTGRLLPIGAGEIKIAFLLTTSSDKKMVVLLSSTGSLPPPTEIPEDPRLYKNWQTQIRDAVPVSNDNPDGIITSTDYSYSDMRTYLTLQAAVNGKKTLIHFQEYGGANTAREVDPKTKNQAQKRVYEYGRERGLHLVSTDTDFVKPEHYLYPNDEKNKFALIDIPLETNWKHAHRASLKTLLERDKPLSPREFLRKHGGR